MALKGGDKVVGRLGSEAVPPRPCVTSHIRWTGKQGNQATKTYTAPYRPTSTIRATHSLRSPAPCSKMQRYWNCSESLTNAVEHRLAVDAVVSYNGLSVRVRALLYTGASAYLLINENLAKKLKHLDTPRDRLTRVVPTGAWKTDDSTLA